MPAIVLIKPSLPYLAGYKDAYVHITTQPDNIASQKVILANGGMLVKRFDKPESLGGGEELLYRIDLSRV